MTAWHQLLRLKPELRSGELTLAEFAADLHEVVSRAGRRPIYEDPAKFFALTYPTLALRELVRDVAARIAGRSAKAVRQLEMTYGRVGRARAAGVGAEPPSGGGGGEGGAEVVAVE